MSLRVMTVAAGAEFGGSETFFVSLTLALKRAGVDVRAAMKAYNIRRKAFDGAGIDYTGVPFLYPGFDFYTPWRIGRAAADFKPDCVLTFTGRGGHMTPPGDYALI